MIPTHLPDNPKPVKTDAVTDWTSRRRLLTALDCGIPDRVPINTYEMPGYNSKDWYNHQPSYTQLMDYIRQHTDCITNWGPPPANLNTPGDFTYIPTSAYPVPVDRTVERDGPVTRTTQIFHTPKGDLRQIREQNANLNTIWDIEHLCKSTEDVKKVMSVPYVPIEYDASDYLRVVKELGDRGIIMASLSDPAYLAATLMDFQSYTLWAYCEPEHYARTVDCFAQRVMNNLTCELKACTVDLYRICGPEYMTPPYLPPDFFKRFMVPHVKQMTDIIHSFGSKVRLHCHGKIAKVLDMFFETGCDGTDPCEPPPDGDIELDQVKRRCMEHHVSVWGNIELKVLEHGTPPEVKANVRKIMEQAKDGGGLILLPTASPINVPLSPKTQTNYFTMIDTALELGRYK